MYNQVVASIDNEDKLRKLWQVLLDSKLICDVIVNRAFVRNIREYR